MFFVFLFTTPLTDSLTNKQTKLNLAFQNEQSPTTTRTTTTTKKGKNIVLLLAQTNKQQRGPERNSKIKCMKRIARQSENRKKRKRQKDTKLCPWYRYL